MGEFCEVVEFEGGEGHGLVMGEAVSVVLGGVVESVGGVCEEGVVGGHE